MASSEPLVLAAGRARLDRAFPWRARLCRKLRTYGHRIATLRNVGDLFD